MDIFKNMISMASFCVGMYLVNRGTEPRNQIRNQILQYGVIWGCGKWTKWTFLKISFLWLPFYVRMYLVMRGTETRNQIRNRILQYGVMGVVVNGQNGQNGNVQKYMIPMASFLCRNVPSHQRYKTK